MARLSQNYIFNFYKIFDGDVAQWLTRRREILENIEITVLYKIQVALLSRKDIFKSYTIFNGNAAQWLTRRREI